MKERRYFYTTLAPYYDKIYHYIDYEAQAKFFDILREKYCLSKGLELIDLCCGTGTHIAIMKKMGYEVIGLDISQEMLNVARNKNPNIKFIQGDITNLQLDGAYDLVLCYFNSILYSRPIMSLKTTLEIIYNHIKTGGILIYDMVDKKIGVNSKVDHYEYKEENLEIVFEPQWIYREKGELIDLYVHLSIEQSGEKREWYDHHIMCAISILELKHILKNIGFSVWILEKNSEIIREWNREDNRVLFVCRKDGQPTF